MLKITRSTDSGTTTLTLSGRIASEHLPDLRRLVQAGAECDLVLNFREVTLVDVDVVRFLVECEAHSIRLAQCPSYVREWMTREQRPP